MKEIRWVKELQENARVKKYILQNFPKPVIPKPELKFNTENLNSSLLGNTIEFFYYLSLSNDLEFNRDFNVIEKGIRNYKRIVEGRMCLQSKYAEIILSEEKYSRFLKIFDLKSTHLKPFPCIEVEDKDWDFSKTLKAMKELDIILLSGDVKAFGIKFEKLFIFQTPNFDTLFNNLYSNFIKEFSVFRTNKKMTINIINKLILLSYLSNKWSTTSLSKLFFAEKKFTFQLKKILVSIDKKTKSTKNTLCKPSLKIENIFATPDFIVKNKIVEIKATKTFFSGADYIQTMLYLLFSSDKSNIKYYGKIEKAIIEYPLFEKSIEIKNPFNSNSKEHLKQILKLVK